MEKKSKNESKSFLELPYSERQIIVVVDDPVVKADRDATASVGSEVGTVDWIEVATKTLLFAYGVTSVTPSVIGELIKAVNRFRDAGNKVRFVSRRDSTALVFPLGHPRDGVLYVGHPAVPQIYYTTAEFHRLTFEHKFCEAIDLLMALGAMEINVEHQSGWGREFSVKLNVPLPNAGEEASATGEGGAEKQRHLLFYASLPGNTAPSVPDGMVWYFHEPTWRQIVKGRMEFGMKDFSLRVRYEDDFGVNAGLKVTAGKAGLDLGGKFEDHESAIWNVHGSFKTS